MKELSYQPYYERAIQENCNGFKPVLGGTGLGKTHGIIQTVQNCTDDRKFIYVAHRKNLLQEMCDSLKKKNIEYVLLKSDEDQLRSLVNSAELKEELRSFFKSKLVDKYVSSLNERKKGGSILLKKARTSLSELPQLFELSKNKPNLDLQDKIDNHVSGIYQFVKKILIDANRIAKGITKNNSKNNKRLKETDYQDLLSKFKAVLLHLFPFIEFANDSKKRVLVLTLHKIFHGLFSGEKTLRINNLKGYIIFLDEYDFLEPILLEKICEEVPIEDPFLMLNYFKINVESKLKTTAYPEGENHEEIKQRLEKTLQKINRLNDSYQFPEIRHFRTSDNSLFGNWIFLTNETIVNQPIYLKINEDEAKFDITSKLSDETKDGFPLLRTVLDTSSSIMKSFAGWKDRNNEIFEEILFDALGHTEFQRIIRRIPFYHSLRNKNKQFVNNYNNLLDRGMGMFTLNKPNDPTEPKEVKIDYYNIPISPERVLLSLIKKNMVFGLSATSKLNRVVNHFDESWFKDQLEKLSDNNIRYFEDYDNYDKQLIQRLTEQKAKERQNTVLLESLKHQCAEEIKSELEVLENIDDNIYGIRNNGGYDKNRVIGFFKILEWIYQKLENGSPISEMRSHLIFLNSLKQIEFFLEYSFKGTNNHQLNKILTVEKDRAIDQIGYRIQYKDTIFYIVFLQKKAYEAIYPDQKDGLSEALQLFWKNKPVIFLTTYPSAANGVNLQYYPSEEYWNKKEQEDFRCIHLLEGPHFYFTSQLADYSRKFTEVKKDLWKSTKLHMNDPISIDNHKNWINVILKSKGNDRKTMNGIYKSLPDYHLNQMATYFQALGRMERVRNRPAGKQFVTLSDSIRKEFETYIYDDQFKNVRDNYQPYYSDFLKQVLSQIKEPKTTGFSAISAKNRQTAENFSKNAVEKLVKQIGQIQNNNLTKERTQEIKNEWYSCRKIALRHEFNNPIIESNHIITLNHHESNEHKEKFNRIYSKIKHVDEINLHFQNNGFALERTNHKNHKWFTDYFVKSILIGAIGEECVKAFLKTNKIKYSPPESVHSTLFEKADIYLPESDIFIDAKNFSEQSIHSYINKEESWADKGVFTKKAFRQLSQLKKVRANARLAIVNVYYASDIKPSFLDMNANYVDVDDNWSIALIPNLIERIEDTWEFASEINSLISILRG